MTLYGAPRSGTNFSTDLLIRNFKNLSLDTEFRQGNWKHGSMIETKIGWLPILIITKNPYAWACSAYRWSQRHPKFQKHKTLQSFLTSPLDISSIVVGSSRPKDITDYPFKRFESPMHYWSQLNKYYAETAVPVSKFILKYEDLVNDPFVAMSFIETLGGEYREERTERIKRECGPSVFFQDKGLFDHSKNDSYIDLLGPNGIDAVNNTMDHEVRELLGYTKIS